MTDGLSEVPVVFSSQQKNLPVSYGVLTDSVLKVSLDINLNRQTKKGKHLSGIKRRGESCTFNGSPLGFPPQQPPAIDLVLLITAHHGKWDHLLLTG